MLDHVAIVGCGMIGSSIGLALKSRGLGRHIVGIARRRDTLTSALAVKAIDEGYTRIGPELARAELVVIATPVDMIAEHVEQTRSFVSPKAIITDAGSVKARILEAVENRSLSKDSVAEFVGSHPLAGSHRSGPGAARGDLFEGRVCVVTPTPTTTASALERVEEFWTKLGMQVCRLSGVEHDKVLARVSHLPHAASYALCLSVEEDDLRLAASGFRDTTRLAGSSAELWASIFLENRSAVLDALDAYQGQFSRIREALKREDRQELETLLNDAKRTRESLGG